MRKLLLVGVILMASFLSRAEEPEKGVRFLDNVAWSEVVKQAKEAGKMIFVDCYTTWCGPCKMLASDVFPREDVGALINEHFVSVKYDVERGEGLAFAKEHRELINAYPTLLMFTTDGELYHRMVGYYPAESMIRVLRVRLSGQTPESLEKEYKAGRRDYDFIMTYLDVLVTAEQMEKYAEVKRDYVRSFPLDSLLNPQVWEIAESVIEKPDSPEYRYVLTHLDEFQSRGFDRYDLEWKLSLTYYYELSSLIDLGFETTNADTLRQMQERLRVLDTLARHPVKSFPEYLACVRVEESFLAADYEEMYYRLIYLGENNLFDNLDWVEGWMNVLLDHLADKEKVMRCVAFLVQLQQAEEAKGDMMIKNLYPTIAKGYSVLGEQAKADEAKRKGEETDQKIKEAFEAFGL